MTTLAIARSAAVPFISPGARAWTSLFMLAAIAAAAVFYAGNVYRIAFSALALEKAESAAAALSTEIAVLDARYLEETGALTPDALAARGLAAGKVSMYIERTASTASLGTSASSGHEL